ncbi:MAG: hypothetical protein ACJ764_10045 [Solirubrobacteraceae bacterium]
MLLRLLIGPGRTAWLRLALALGLLSAVALPAQAPARGRAAHASSGKPRCTYAFYDQSSDAPGLTGQQEDQLDLVQGTLGLNPTHTKLRVVLNLKNLSKTIAPGSNYNDYSLYWKNPSGDTGPNAVDVTVNSSGKVTYTDGTVTLVNGNSQYNASGTTAATGKFGHGRNGAIEIDVPLSELKLKVGKVLGKPTGQTASGASTPVGSLGGIADSDVGKSYKLGQPTCIDPERHRKR